MTGAARWCGTWRSHSALLHSGFIPWAALPHFRVHEGEEDMLVGRGLKRAELRPWMRHFAVAVVSFTLGLHASMLLKMLAGYLLQSVVSKKLESKPPFRWLEP